MLKDFRLPKDSQGNVYFDPEFGAFAEKQITYTATGNGATGAVTLFTVTGLVGMKVVAKCSTTLTIQAGATIEIGTALSIAGLIAQTAGDAIDVNEIWHDATPDASVELSSVMNRSIVSQNVIQTVATDTIDTGVIKFFCMWYPISSDGNVVAA